MCAVFKIMKLAVIYEYLSYAVPLLVVWCEGVFFHSLLWFPLALPPPRINIVQLKACLCYIIKDFNANPLSASLIVLLPINLFCIYILEPTSTIFIAWHSIRLFTHFISNLNNQPVFYISQMEKRSS